MKKILLCFVLVLSSFICLPQAHAQGTTAFTYQGQLKDNGTNANGNYTMIFGLYDAVTNGDLVAGPITNNAVLANGLFTVNLDFGAGAFNGSARWLDITITNGGATQELSPRVQVLPAPYALYAAVAQTASHVASGVEITNALLTNSVFAGNGGGLTNLNVSALVAGTNINAVTFNNPTNVFAGTFSGAFAGNGAGLTNLNASQLMSIGNANAGGNFFVGSSGNAATSGGNNTALGSSALNTNTSGANNTAVGNASLAGNTTGSFNTAHGVNTLLQNTVGSQNTAVGFGALESNTNGSFNTAIGSSAISASSSGSNNIAVGYQAGLNSAAGSSNIFIGNPGQAADNNIIRIGNGQTNIYLAGAIVGNGYGVTNIPASSIVGLLYRNPIVEATTTNLPPYGASATTITGVSNSSLGQLTLDGVVVQTGDSVLVKNETAAANNGIYVCTTNNTANVYSLARRSDFNSPTNIATGEAFTVTEGIVNAGSEWYLTSKGPFTVGSTALTFAQLLSLPSNLFTNTPNGVAFASGQVVKTLNNLTDTVTLTPGNNMAIFTNGNSLQISSFVPNIQLFHGVTSATFTVPTNVTRIMVEMWGGGGGGGAGYYGAASDGNGNSNGGADNAFNGGGGGAGAYAWNVFTVTNGSSFTVTAPGDASGGQSGGTSSFTGNGISLTAAGGSAGQAGNANGPGNGGSGGNSTGSIVDIEGGNGDSNGNGGGVWRGASISLVSGAQAGGPGGGGTGGSAGYNGSSGYADPGQGGDTGVVIIYY